MIFWEDIDPKGIQAKCEYSDGIYTITVAKDEMKLTETFGQTFTPTFGMDVEDKRQSMLIAEKLAFKLEVDLEI